MATPLIYEELICQLDLGFLSKILGGIFPKIWWNNILQSWTKFKGAE